MADSAAFEEAATRLEADCGLDRLEARGTVRLALKEAGLDAASVTPEQMRVIAERVLPNELSARGVQAPETVCEQLAERLAEMDTLAEPESPEDVFGRLGGETDR